MNRSGHRLLPALLFFSLLSAPFAAGAGATQGARPLPPDMDRFSYTSQDRRDPFEPVYLLKAAKRTSARRPQRRDTSSTS